MTCRFCINTCICCLLALQRFLSPPPTVYNHSFLYSPHQLANMNLQSGKSIKGPVTHTLTRLWELAKHRIRRKRATVDPWCVRSRSGKEGNRTSSSGSSFSFCGCKSCWDDDFDVLTTVRGEVRRRLALAFGKKKKHVARGWGKSLP